MLRLLILLATIISACHTDNILLDDFSRANTQFSAELYKELSNREGGNFLACPLSLQTVLALTITGAQGTTFTEATNGLKLPQDVAKIDETFGQLVRVLKNGASDYYALSSANRLFTKTGLPLNQTFVQNAQRYFDAGIEQLDFAGGKKSALHAAKRINAFVEKATDYKIHDIIEPEDLNPMTRLILVNAMYFKARWHHQFDTTDTTKQPFYLSDTDTEDVDMMLNTDYFHYYENQELDCKFLELPYEGSSGVTMTIVLPNKKGFNALKVLEARIGEVFRPQPYGKPRHVRVQIPRFTIEHTTEFTPILQRLDIKQLFSPEADLGGISKDAGLFVDKVKQKAFINLTESGTEAAAATSVQILERLGEEENFDLSLFTAEHPFLFLIKTNDIIVFYGRILKIKT